MSDAPKLLFVGRLLYWKGAYLALTAFQQVSRRIPTARFTIVGRGPEEGVLRDLADQLGVADKVTFVPWMAQGDLFDLYKEHDLFLFPSLHDSGGMVVLEALCRGLPVVCLDLGGPKEVVDRTCGAVVGTANRNSAQVGEALAQAVLTILSDRDRWRNLSSGAIARARAFLWPHRVAQFYRSIQPYLDGVQVEAAASSKAEAELELTESGR
jgi:glycosyltransferase involved in cell wall biosynthesis